MFTSIVGVFHFWYAPILLLLNLGNGATYINLNYTSLDCNTTLNSDKWVGDKKGIR